MAEEILKMINITRQFVSITALDRVQFSCSRGKVHALAKENGAGESIILKILAGIHQADEEGIYFHGKKVVIWNPERSQKLGITMVLQELTLVREMMVWENIYLGQKPVTRLGKINRREVKERTLGVMDYCGIHIDPNVLVGSLPVAEQQMTEIPKILVGNPELTILDGPTSALAKKEVGQLYQIIHNLVTDGKTIIFISHRLEGSPELRDQITVFRDGCYIGTRDMNEISEDDLMRMMVGRSLNRVFPPPVYEVDDSQVILEVKNLADANHKLNQVNFQAHRGEVLGVAGLQGHGQTELLNAANGLYPLSGGSIAVNGGQTGIEGAGQVIVNRVALVLSDRKNQGLMLEFSNRHNLAIFSTEKRMKGCFTDKKAEQAFSEPMASKLSIGIGGLDLPVSSLSGRNQQKAALSKKLVTEPRAILFDEPACGTDVETKRRSYQVIHDLAARGAAVVMSSGDMLEVIDINSWVTVMYEDRISGVLRKEELTEERIIQLGMRLGENRKEGEKG